MSKKKPIKQAKFPSLGRALCSPYVLLVMVLLAAGSTGAAVKGGYDSWQRISAPYVKDSPYVSGLDLEPSPGMSWAKKFASIAPEGETDWRHGDLISAAKIVQNVKCSPTTTQSALGTFVAGSDNVKLRVSLFSAGMAYKFHTDNAEVLAECLGGTYNKDAPGSAIVHPQGFVFTLGDAVIALETANRDSVEKLLAYYMEHARQTLVDYDCANIEPGASDGKRNPFAGKDTYVGLELAEKVDTKVKTDGLPVFKPEPIASLPEGEPLDAPLAPLPEGMASQMPKQVEKPVVPQTVEAQVDFSQDAAFQVVDTVGPGCGWKWSAMEQPIYDLDALSAGKKASLDKTQREVDAKASDYVSRYKGFMYQYSLTSPSIRQWNKYVSRYNSVQKQWRELVQARDEIEQPYLDYVKAHDDWLGFDKRKEKATKEYTEELKECKAKQEELSKWLEEYLDPTSRPDKVPPRPEGCDKVPPRPEILDEQKPDEPTMPDLPSNITIPDSWPKPKVKVEDLDI